MKADKIKKLLKGVMGNLIKSIKDDEVKSILEKESFITGGCIPSMLLDEYINDFDIYLTSREATEKVLAYYKKNYNEEEGKLLKDEKKFEPKLITNNAINLTDKVQIITRFYGDPETVTDNFDWQHIKSYYQYPDELTLKDDIYKLIVEKDLVYTGSEYPLSSLFRTRKFIKKGWTVDDKTLLRITLDVCNLLMRTGRTVGIDFGKVTSPESIEDEDPREEVETEMFRQEISVDELIEQLNGVDPITMQGIIESETGTYLTMSEIIERL